MGILIAAVVQLSVGLVGVLAGLVGLLLGAAGGVIGLGVTATVGVLVVLGVLLSPWFLLGLGVWLTWKLLRLGRPHRRTWTVVR